MERFMDDIDRFGRKKILGTCFRFWGDIVEEDSDSDAMVEITNKDNSKIFTMKTGTCREHIPPMKEANQKTS